MKITTALMALVMASFIGLSAQVASAAPVQKNIGIHLGFGHRHHHHHHHHHHRHHR
jgi:hypothetical protein